MIFEQIPSGGDRNFGYILACEETRLAAVVDPSPDPLACAARVDALGLTVRFVLNTHSHYDHASGNAHFQRAHRALVVAYDDPADRRVEDGDIIDLGRSSLRVFHTPGHTPDSICILAGKRLITGDTLFVGKVGGTYSREEARVEFESLKRLMTLPDEIEVWPGHDVGVRPSSTIGEEKTTNPFCLRLNDFSDFFWLKENWAAYKKEHGIR